MLKFRPLPPDRSLPWPTEHWYPPVESRRSLGPPQRPAVRICDPVVRPSARLDEGLRTGPGGGSRTRPSADRNQRAVSRRSRHAVSVRPASSRWWRVLRRFFPPRTTCATPASRSASTRARRFSVFHYSRTRFGPRAGPVAANAAGSSSTSRRRSTVVSARSVRAHCTRTAQEEQRHQLGGADHGASTELLVMVHVRCPGGSAVQVPGPGDQRAVGHHHDAGTASMTPSRNTSATRTG